ncbi:MAG: helix-hairpin-helix domain-containing protein [Armatimonadota bacterium]
MSDKSSSSEDDQATSSTTSDLDSSVSTKVIVHVAGCVKCPGVYLLDRDARVIDAIKAAGGVKQNADTDSINLAAKIVDGSRIYVPAKGEGATAGANTTTTIAGSVTHGSLSATRRMFGTPRVVVNINTAGVDELDLLPGVGPVTAQKIIDYRRRIGRFTSVEQLLNVKGIGAKKLEQMRPYVTL